MLHPLLLGLHLLAAVAWVGGLTFNLFVALPAARQIHGPGREFHRFLGTEGARIARALPPLMALLLATGAALLALSPPVGTDPVLNIAKVALFGMMVALYLRGARSIWPRMVFALDGELPALQERYWRNAAAMWGCGVAAVFLGAFARYA
ncbi:MAG: hypothetical protein QXO51_00685 [Halobacteria archaeon]